MNCAWGRCSKVQRGTIRNLSKSQWWAFFWTSALFTAWFWMSLLKQDQIYGQNNDSDLGSLSDISHWSKDWICPHTRNFPSNAIRTIQLGNIFLLSFLETNFSVLGAGDNKSNFPQTRMLQMLDSRLASVQPQLTRYLSDRMVWVGELSKMSACCASECGFNSKDTTTSERNPSNRSCHASLGSNFFFCIQLLGACAIYRQEESKQGRKEINITGCQLQADTVLSILM